MKTFLRGLVVLTGLCCAWQLVVTLFALPDYILPTPFAVAHMFYLRFDLILHETGITVVETVSGLLIGSLIGCVAALFMTFFQSVSLWLLPVMIISQAIPTFAIAPLLVIWFGYGMISKIVTTVIMLFFPVTSAFFDGLRQTPTGWIELAKTMNAKKWRFFCYIRIPAALPHLASGLRVAAVVAPIGAVIGEWVGASKGLGFLLLNANARMQIDLMFAGLVMLVMFTLVLYFVIDKLLRKIIYWQMPI